MTFSLPEGEGGGGFPYKKHGVLVVPFRGLKGVLVPLRVFSLKRSTAGALAVPFRVLSRENYDMRHLSLVFTSDASIKHKQHTQTH